MPIFLTRYKSSRSSGIVVAHHEAADEQRAALSARAWCNAEPGRMYINTQPWIAFTDANLAPADEQDGIDGQPRRGPGRPRKDGIASPLPV